MIAENVPIEEAVQDDANNDHIYYALLSLGRDTPSDEDISYKPLYYGLFNGISLIIENTKTYDQTIAALKHLQSKAEDAFIEQ